MQDTELMRLSAERLKLLAELSRLLKYAGPNHPHRAKENIKRKIHRKRVKGNLKTNALGICARVMEICNKERDIIQATGERS